jgi:TPR repeat protein
MCRGAALAFLTFLFLVGEAAAQRATPWADDVGEFYRASARGDEPTMLRTALRLAEGRKGPHWATVVGDLYWQGRGAAADPAEAVKWYRRAAVRGGELAMLALARAHHTGKGTELDAEAAFFWLSQAASHRLPRAILEQAIYTRRGIPFARDDAHAEQQISRAVELLYQRTRIEEETKPDSMPARRAAYARAFRIFACPWAAPPDPVQARRYLALAIKEGWSEGKAFLPRFEQAEPDLSNTCERD